jgi:hypothetical protein
MLRQFAVTVPALAATTQAGTWRPGGAQLLLAEAFITASGKPEPLPAGQRAAPPTWPPAPDLRSVSRDNGHGRRPALPM